MLPFLDFLSIFPGLLHPAGFRLHGLPGVRGGERFQGAAAGQLGLPGLRPFVDVHPQAVGAGVGRPRQPHLRGGGAHGDIIRKRRFHVVDNSYERQSTVYSSDKSLFICVYSRAIKEL